jgi:hypothetical protein
MLTDLSGTVRPHSGLMQAKTQLTDRSDGARPILHVRTYYPLQKSARQIGRFADRSKLGRQHRHGINHVCRLPIVLYHCFRRPRIVRTLRARCQDCLMPHARAGQPINSDAGGLPPSHRHLAGALEIYSLHSQISGCTRFSRDFNFFLKRPSFLQSICSLIK